VTVEITVNGRPQQIPDGTSVAELLELLQCETRHVAVEVNMELVPRGRHAERRLASGDRLEIVTLVGGG
jgi:sulfur carrier protein